MRTSDKNGARNLAEVKRLLKEGGGEFGERLEQFSARFLESPYLAIRSEAAQRYWEALVIRFDGFDCVTYVETVLALAAARTATAFSDALREMRYHNGKVEWHSRNHYMVDWIKNNQRRGIIKDITNGSQATTKTRRLSIIKELRARSATFRVFPKQKVAHIRRLAETGDIALFASTRRNLDVFHMGIIIKRDGEVLLRHASRTAGRVIDQLLADFLKEQRMSGIILLRPLCQR